MVPGWRVSRTLAGRIDLRTCNAQKRANVSHWSCVVYLRRMVPSNSIISRGVSRRGRFARMRCDFNLFFGVCRCVSSVKRSRRNL